ncbi:hypothetical protein [Arthrobacter sp. CAN_C5]|uniref:hypothetical protein n=1 Tax=Arthrobacter sp. CAN_C5 TaxID=2760706 RepID=UPI001AE9DE39|nr:hypothetical protein [Arthrobacter sp. CAN_C5]MBP2216313.1 Mg2+ and Co2+ transporter CorA [Arthrobacter sp. CAN_C5]
MGKTATSGIVILGLAIALTLFGLTNLALAAIAFGIALVFFTLSATNKEVLRVQKSEETITESLSNLAIKIAAISETLEKQHEVQSRGISENRENNDNHRKSLGLIFRHLKTIDSTINTHSVKISNMDDQNENNLAVQLLALQSSQREIVRIIDCAQEIKTPSSVGE